MTKMTVTKMKTSLLSTLLIHTFFTAFLSTNGAQADASSFYFLKSEAAHQEYEVSPPPEAGSTEDIKDLDQVKAYQKSRTAEDCKRAQFEVVPSLEHFYGAPYGTLSAAQIHVLDSFFTRLEYDVDVVVHRYKQKWSRPRPYTRDPLIEPCLRLEGSKAYPSGHAGISWAAGRALSELFPEQSDVFMKRAKQIGSDRVLGGVHHPSDVEAGQKLADQVYAEVKKTAAFKKEWPNLVKELKDLKKAETVKPEN